MTENAPRIFGFAGWSGSGKTTLLCAVIPHIVAAGFKLSTIKHAHHTFDVDQPGKDSFRHRSAGATEVMIASASRWALMHELRNQSEPEPEQLWSHMAPVDLILIEGFKRQPHPRLEVHRPALGKPLLCLDDERIVAIASDAPVPEATSPRLDLNDPPAIAQFIMRHVGLVPA